MKKKNREPKSELDSLYVCVVINLVQITLKPRLIVLVKLQHLTEKL